MGRAKVDTKEVEEVFDRPVGWVEERGGREGGREGGGEGWGRGEGEGGRRGGGGRRGRRRGGWEDGFSSCAVVSFSFSPFWRGRREKRKHRNNNFFAQKSTKIKRNSVKKPLD